MPFDIQTCKTYRLICQAWWQAGVRGCSGNGPTGTSAEEAREAAVEAGWALRNGVWCCPAHIQDEETT